MTVSPKASQMCTDQKIKRKKVVAQKDRHRAQKANGYKNRRKSTPNTTIGITDQTAAKHFMVIKEHTGPVCRLRFMNEKIVAFKTMLESVFFRRLSMQARSAKNHTIAQPKLLPSEHVALSIGS